MNFIFTSVKYLISEHKNNLSRIWFVSKAHLKKQTSVTSLGIGWVVVHDVIYFGTFALFRFMLSGGSNIEGMNLIMYLLTGMVPWFFISDVLNSGTRCFVDNRSIYTSMKFPTSIIPTYETISIFIKRLISFALLFIVTAIFGYYQYFNILLFLYYTVAMFCISLVLCMLISPLVSISKDLDQMYRAIMRILFFLLPVIWSFDLVVRISPVIVTIIKLNPITYVLIGFRDAFFYGELPSWEYTVYFWFVTGGLFIVASILLNKLNKYYDDWV